MSQAATREFAEETGSLINASSLNHVAILNFQFPDKPAWDQCVYVYTSKFPSQEPVESQEMIPRWFPIHKVPYQYMWDDARYWLLRMLDGETFQAAFYYQPDNVTVSGVVFNPLEI